MTTSQHNPLGVPRPFAFSREVNDEIRVKSNPRQFSTLQGRPNIQTEWEGLTHIILRKLCSIQFMTQSAESYKHLEVMILTAPLPTPEKKINYTVWKGSLQKYIIEKSRREEDSHSLRPARFTFSILTYATKSMGDRSSPCLQMRSMRRDATSSGSHWKRLAGLRWKQDLSDSIAKSKVSDKNQM